MIDAQAIHPSRHRVPPGRVREPSPRHGVEPGERRRRRVAQAGDGLRENLLSQILGSFVIPGPAPHISIHVLVVAAERAFGNVTHNRLLEQRSRK
jgi:hypothetical protein